MKKPDFKSRAAGERDEENATSKTTTQNAVGLIDESEVPTVSRMGKRSALLDTAEWRAADRANEQGPTGKEGAAHPAQRGDAEDWQEPQGHGNRVQASPDDALQTHELEVRHLAQGRGVICEKRNRCLEKEVTTRLLSVGFSQHPAGGEGVSGRLYAQVHECATPF